jgi:hypothetical protein
MSTPRLLARLNGVRRAASYNSPTLRPKVPTILSSALLPTGRWPHLQLASLNTYPSFRPKLPYAEYEVLQASAPVSDKSPAGIWELDKSGQLQLNNAVLTVASEDDLTIELGWVASNRASMHITRALWDYMRKERQIRPVVVHYEALVLANCDPIHGSISNVKDLLKEMTLAGIAIGGTIDAAVLQVRRTGQRHRFR